MVLVSMVVPLGRSAVRQIPENRYVINKLLAELPEEDYLPMFAEPPCDVEVKEQTDWLKLADSICHDPWRKRDVKS
jgi:hypothetical protein